MKKVFKHGLIGRNIKNLKNMDLDPFKKPLIGLAGGGAALKVWKKFVEKLFKEEMTKPTFRNLNPKNKEWAEGIVENYNKKLPGITKKFEEFKKTGKLPEDMHVDDIFQKGAWNLVIMSISVDTTPKNCKKRRLITIITEKY